jgi:hypothetical protein
MRLGIRGAKLITKRTELQFVDDFFVGAIWLRSARIELPQKIQRRERISLRAVDELNATFAS